MTDIKTFLGNAGDVARIVKPTLIVAKSTADNDLVVLEADPVTGALVVNASVTAGPIQYTRNAANTLVTRDTATPANNRPLPVELLAGDALAAIAVAAGNSSATTLRVVVATDQATLPVSVAGVATAANQVTTNAALSTLVSQTDGVEASLSSIDSKAPALVGGRVPVDVGASVLPSGASTSALQTTGNTSAASLDTKAVQQALNYGAATGAVRVAAQLGNASAIADFAAGATGAQTLRVSANITRDGTALAYNTGASDANTPRVSANLALAGTAALTNYGTPTAASQNIAAMLGVGSTAVSATNPVPVSSGSGSAAVQLVSATQRPYFQDFASGSLTTSYTQIIASSGSVINSFSATNNTSEPIFIGTGAAASEVVQYILMPGENAMNIKLQIATSTRIAIRAAVNTLTSGQFSLNVFA